MDSNSINAPNFPMTFVGDNTLIAKVGSDWKQIFSNIIAQLDAGGKTVITTDTYIFCTDGSTTYKEDLVNMLLTMNAKKIIFGSYKSVGNRTIRNYVEQTLKANGLEVEFKTVAAHDRYWICLENEKAFLAGSLNGIGKNIVSVLPLPAEDVIALKEDLSNQGVI